MSLSIHPIKLGVACCYVIREEGTILIDGGAPKQARNFMKGIETLSIKPQEIRLIVITHGHWDHIGSATVYPAHGKPFSADAIRKTLL